MVLKQIKFMLSLFLLALACPLPAGTLIYRINGKGETLTTSKIKIISIQDKRLTIEQDGGRQTIPLSWVEKYFDTDIPGSSFVDNTSDYDINIIKVDIPDTGYTFSTEDGKRRKNVAVCSIEYRINRKYEPGKTQAVKMPYFYLYVLTTRDKEYGQRPAYTFFYPKEAKVKSKSYDEAKIIETISGIDRPLIHDKAIRQLGTPARKSGLSSMGNLVAEIPLKGIRGRHIVAYRLDIWGKDKIVASKEWQRPRYNPGKFWWKKH